MIGVQAQAHHNEWLTRSVYIAQDIAYKYIHTSVHYVCTYAIVWTWHLYNGARRGVFTYYVHYLHVLYTLHVMHVCVYTKAS